MNFPLNRTDFKLFRGLGNPIQILIRDVDRAPVTFAQGIVPVVNIIDRDSQQVVFTSPLTLVDAGQSLWTFTVQPTDIADWSPRRFIYTIFTVDANGNKLALYMNRGYQLEGEVEIIDGPYPPRISASVIPLANFLTSNSILYGPAVPGAAQVNNLSGLHTAAVYGTGLTGTVQVEALLDETALSSNDQWLVVETIALTNLSGIQNFNFEGNYYWVRFVVTITSGTLTQILVRN